MIFIPKSQRFGLHTVGDMCKLCGKRLLDWNLQPIKLKRKDISLFNLKDQIKFQAREFYTKWATSEVSERTNPELGEIIINRVGWKHMTRSNRKTERIIQSFLLLGVAKRMIKEVQVSERFAHPEFKMDGDTGVFLDYVGLRAFASFPHRYESAIVVVLKRQVKKNLQSGQELSRTIWFYSIYESSRSRTLKYFERNDLKI